MSDEIKIFKVLDFLRDASPRYAKAKAERVYLDEWRKSKKAILMQSSGSKTSAAQEVDAYAHPEYLEVLNALKIAVEEEEKLRWQLFAAQARCEVFRTLQANNRFESKTLGG